MHNRIEAAKGDITTFKADAIVNAAKFVIHTVGPVWHGGNNNEDELLANCYKNSLKLAEYNYIKIIAFPSISTGVYSFPFECACKIAIKTVKEFLENNTSIEKVIFVCFSESDFEVYERFLIEHR